MKVMIARVVKCPEGRKFPRSASKVQRFTLIPDPELGGIYHNRPPSNLKFLDIGEVC